MNRTDHLENVVIFWFALTGFVIPALVIGFNVAVEVTWFFIHKDEPAEVMPAPPLEKKWYLPYGQVIAELNEEDGPPQLPLSPLGVSPKNLVDSLA